MRQRCDISRQIIHVISEQIYQCLFENDFGDPLPSDSVEWDVEFCRRKLRQPACGGLIPSLMASRKLVQTSKSIWEMPLRHFPDWLLNDSSNIRKAPINHTKLNSPLPPPPFFFFLKSLASSSSLLATQRSDTPSPPQASFRPVLRFPLLSFVQTFFFFLSAFFNQSDCPSSTPAASLWEPTGFCKKAFCGVINTRLARVFWARGATVCVCEWWGAGGFSRMCNGK